MIIPDGVTRISQYAFEKNKCRKIKKIIFPKTLKRIPNSNFCYWDNLEEVIIPEGVKTIGEDAFAGTGIQKILLPSTIDKIERGAFSSCDKLYKITLTHITTSVLNSLLNGEYLEVTGKREWKLAFKLFFGSSEDIELTEFFRYYNYNRETLKFSLSNWFVLYGNYIIGYVGKEKNLTLPECATGIAAEAFADNQNIQSITFNNKINFIGRCAFDGCKFLHTVNLNDSIVTIGDYAFADTGIKNITIPVKVKDVGELAFTECKRLERITIMRELHEGFYRIDSWNCYWKNGCCCDVNYEYINS